MSNSPTERTSTIGSSTNSPSEVSTSSTTERIALIACGALAQPAAEVVSRREWPVDVHPLPPLLHNHPEQISPAVAELANTLRDSYSQIVVGYADCGTYGALDTVCDELGLTRLPGLHCYDVYGGAERMQRFFEDQPGTYVFTDFLVRSFHRTVLRELGLDRMPELREAYFGNYTRVIWLAQRPDDLELMALAESAAEHIGLPLTVIRTGHDGLERVLADLVSPVDPRTQLAT